MDLDELVSRQDGVLARAQALTCGIPARTVARRVANREWRALSRGVYLLLRRRDLAAPDRVSLDGIALTALPLTVLETATQPGAGTAFLDRALQRYVGFAELYAAYCRNTGAHGMRRAGELLVAAADRADSAAERRLLRLLRDAGIIGYVRGLAVGPWLLDVAFPASRVWLEVDGWAWHADVERFRADRRKQNALVAEGWTVLRFTWSDLTDRPDDTVRRVRVALRSRR